MANKEELTPEQQEIALLKAQLAEANKEKEEQAQLIDEQNERLALADASKGQKFPVVAHEKKKYQICAARIQNPLKKEETLTAAELAQNKEVIAHLVKIGSGVLALVEPSK